MDIQFFGANCIVISTKNARLVVDDNLADMGSKSPAKSGDVALFTGPQHSSPKDARLMIDQPGEYEVLGMLVEGIAADPVAGEGTKTSTLYKISFDDVSVLITGHIASSLSELQAEAVGMVDVMFVPVGGGATLGGADALKLIKKVEPKLVVPTYYASNKLKLDDSPKSLNDSLSDLGMEVQETTSKLRLKPGGLVDALQQLVVLEEQ